MQIVRTAIEVNMGQRQHVVDRLQEQLKVLRGRTIGLLGLAFKGNTDDLRDAPALTLIELLTERGAIVKVHDPVAMPNAQAQHPELQVDYAEDVQDLARGCDALVVVTDWDAYRHLPLTELRGLMRGAVLMDARNLLNQEEAVSAGFSYVGVGR